LPGLARRAVLGAVSPSGLGFGSRFLAVRLVLSGRGSRRCSRRLRPSRRGPASRAGRFLPSWPFSGRPVAAYPVERQCPGWGWCARWGGRAVGGGAAFGCSAQADSGWFSVYRRSRPAPCSGGRLIRAGAGAVLGGLWWPPECQRIPAPWRPLPPALVRGHCPFGRAGMAARAAAGAPAVGGGLREASSPAFGAREFVARARPGRSGCGCPRW